MPWIAASLLIVFWLFVTCGGMSIGYWLAGTLITIVASYVFADFLLGDQALSWLFASFGYVCIGWIIFSLFGETVAVMGREIQWDRNAFVLPYVFTIVVFVIWKSTKLFIQLAEESENEPST